MLPALDWKAFVQALRSHTLEHQSHLERTLGEYEILHHVYQPGQVIAERARPVRHVHVIVAGEVELVSGEEIVESLRAGDHFGRKSIELSRADTARARTLVRTVALRADQANQLQDVLLSTERIVARTGTFQTIRAEDPPSPPD